MEQAGVQLIAQGAGAFDADMKSATSATNTFVDATEKGGGRISAAGNIMTGALRELGSLATQAFVQAAKATAAFVGDSINLAGDFEAGMLNFQAVAGKDVDTKGLEQFRDLFLQIGKELPVSTADVQKAAIEMIKGGIDPAIVAAGGLKQNIQFAAAAMDGDLVSAAEISAKILGGWTSSAASAQERTDFLTHSTDLMTKAANASAVDVKGLSQGIFNAQGIAKTAGVSFDDLTTSLALLAPRFASSSEAGNSLKNMIARLQPTTEPATDAMTALGLYTEETGSAFYDAAGNFIGFEQSAQLLQDSLKGLTKEQQAATLQQIFGNDAMGSAAALADLGAAGYQSMAAAMAEANGVAENAALKQQGFNTALDNAKGSVEALQITIGSALMPILTDLMNNVVAPGVNTLTDMADALAGNGDAFDRLSPTMQGIVSVIGTLVADTQEVIGAFDDAGAMSVEFAMTIGDLADDLGLPGDLITDIVFAVQDLVSWFGDAGDESSNLGGAINDLNDIWTKAKDTITNVANGYKDVIDSVLPQITQFIDDHGTEISAFFQTAWGKIKDIVDLALQVYNDTVPPILHAVAGFIDDHGSEIQKILKGAWDAVSSLIDGTLETIKTTLKLALDIIHGDWGAAWEDIKHIGETQVEAIKGVVKGFLDAIAGLFDTTIDDLVQTWEDNWDMMVNIVSNIDWADVGQNAVDGILEGLRGAWGSLVSWVAEKASGLVDAALDAIGAHSPATAFMPVGQFSVQGIMAGFENMWPELEAMVSTMGDDLVGQAADIADSVQSAIADAFGATASIDRQKVSNLNALDKLDDKRRAGVQSQIDAAEKIALAMDDPQEAANYFKMRSKQLLELGELGDKINKETDRDERAKLQARYDLINAAQQAEMKQFDAEQKSSQSGTEAIAGSLNDLMKSLAGVNLTDAQIHMVDALTGLFTQLSSISPVASPQQIQGAQQGGASYSQSKTINMPIYTNNTPAAIQNSWAIIQASYA